jgi:hypothetical protein
MQLGRMLYSPFTDEEDTLIQQAYEKLGNRWTQIAELLPVSGRCSARVVAQSRFLP